MLKKAAIIAVIGFFLLVALAYFRYIFNKPYNLLADSKSEIVESISELDTNELLIVVLGANWCPECRQLSTEIESEPLKNLTDTKLSFVKVDVNGWDRNMDIVRILGNPAGGGIPAIAVIDNQGHILTARTGKQLSKDKKAMGSYYNYFFWLSDTYINNKHSIYSDKRIPTINFNLD